MLVSDRKMGLISGSIKAVSRIEERPGELQGMGSLFRFRPSGLKKALLL
jgi:hypothetical protein